MSLSERGVLVIGAGGLGCPVAIGLAAAGVGRMLVLDHDTVDESNLARQMLFGDHDIGKPKALVLEQAIRDRVPHTVTASRAHRFGRDEVTRALIQEVDLIVDCSDNFATRFAANDLCVELGKPLVHGAAIRWQGQVLSILPGRSPCLRCVFESEPPPGAAPTCAEAGVISPLVGLIGAWMADAAVAILSNTTPATAGAMRTFDGWTGRERLVPVGQDPDCSVCGKRGA